MDKFKRRERMRARRQDPEYLEKRRARAAKRYAEGTGAMGKYKRGKHPELTYVIQDEHERVKIGSTINLEYRLGLLQCGNADLLTVVDTVPGNHEVHMHEKFFRLKIRGEWFSAAPEIFQEILALKH